MKGNRFFVFILILSGLITYFSCRKIDRLPEAPIEKTTDESKFFTRHAPTDPYIQALLQYVKRENNKYSFVNNLIKQIGYPHWDKAIVTSGKRKMGHRNGTDSSSNTTFIPFALDSQNIVNASLVITTTPSDTTFQFLRDWQYQSRMNGSPLVDTTAENLATLFMMFDNLVFGHTRFKITDSILFASMPKPSGYTGSDIVINNSFNAGGRGNQSQLATTVCFYGYHCGTPASLACTGPDGCDYLNCPTNQCHAITTCYDFEPASGSGGGGAGGTGGTGGGSGGSGSGGGSGGGGWTPPQCPVSSRSNVFYECIPGWEPFPGTGTTPPKDPCDKVARLKTDTAYINRAMEIKNSTSLNFEKAYIQRNDGIYFYKEGPANEGRVDLTIRDTVLNINHAHYKGKMFSIEDLSAVWAFMIAHRLVDSAFTLGVSTNAGASYVVTIDDPGLFLQFCNTYFADETNAGQIEDNYRSYKVGKYAIQSQNEKAFLELAKDTNMGISLLRANENFTGYSKLILDRLGNLAVVPCN